MAFAQDAAGNRSPPSTAVDFSVDRQAPNAPRIAQPAAGSWLSVSLPTLAGQADAGNQVEVRVDGLPACNAVADGAGSWSCVGDTALDDGLHVAVAFATSPAGNGPVASTPIPFTVATSGPAAPVILEPAAGAFLPTATPLFRGHAAAAGLGLRILVGGNPACETSTQADGAWSCVSAPLAEGSHTAVALAADSAGNLSTPSAAVSFTVKTIAPPAPTLLAPAHASLVTEPWPLIAGTAEGHARIEARVNGAPACEAAADASGAWACRPFTPLDEGDHWVHAAAWDRAGNASPPSQAHH